MEQAKGSPLWEVVGGLFFLNEITNTKITFALGQGTNNKVELSTLWSVLWVASEKPVRRIQIYGDSKMTIDWANGQLQINAPHLQHLLKAIRDQISTLNQFPFNMFIER